MKDPKKEVLREFKNYLKETGLSQTTQKNYLADLRHFLKFVETKKATLLCHSELVSESAQMLKQVQHDTTKLFSEYHDFLTTTPLSLSSINRKLSSLRKFGQFLFESGKLDHNPAQKIKNLTPLSRKIKKIKTKPPRPSLSPFKKPFFFTSLFLFLSLIFAVSFLKTSASSPPLAQTPERTTKTLTLQGRLENQKNQPLSGLTLANFQLWDQEKGGNQLYSSGDCFIKPNPNGIFSIVIGQDCGKPIPAILFSRYPKIFLQLNISGQEKKLARQLILDTEPSFLTFQKPSPTPTPFPLHLTEDNYLAKLLKSLTTESQLSTASQAGAAKDFVLEFDFQTGKENFQAVLSPKPEKAYYFSWNKDNLLSMGKIVNDQKIEFVKSEKTWQEETWSKGKISFLNSILSFKIGETSISTPLNEESEILTKDTAIRFEGDLKSITNLQISSSQ